MAAKTEPETFTLDELHTVTVPSGRCPHCGRPSGATEAKVFQDLREGSAAAADRLAKAEGLVERLKEERDQLKVRNADLRAELKDVKAG